MNTGNMNPRAVHYNTLHEFSDLKTFESKEPFASFEIGESYGES